MPCGHCITQWKDALFNPPALEMYARPVPDKGATLQNCFGFINGTVRPIARPDQHQRVMYTGHKRIHTLKFQFLVLPNGLIINLYGPAGNYVFRDAVIYQLLIHMYLFCFEKQSYEVVINMLFERQHFIIF